MDNKGDDLKIEVSEFPLYGRVSSVSIEQTHNYFGMRDMIRKDEEDIVEEDNCCRDLCRRCAIIIFENKYLIAAMIFFFRATLLIDIFSDIWITSSIYSKNGPIDLFWVMCSIVSIPHILCFISLLFSILRYKWIDTRYKRILVSIVYMLIGFPYFVCYDIWISIRYITTNPVDDRISSYILTRFLTEVVCESVPQLIVQLYIWFFDDYEDITEGAILIFSTLFSTISIIKLIGVTLSRSKRNEMKYWQYLRSIFTAGFGLIPYSQAIQNNTIEGVKYPGILTQNQIKTLFGILKDTQVLSLRSLSITNSSLDNDLINGIADVFNKNPKLLYELDLSNCNIINIEPLCTSILTNSSKTKLKKLNLSHNYIENKDLDNLVEVAKCETLSLEDLDISFNDFGDCGASIESLLNGTKIRNLNISGIHFEQQDVVRISRTFNKSSNLETLVIKNTSIDSSEKIRSICQYLIHNQNIRKLDISNDDRINKCKNNLSNEGIDRIKKLLDSDKNNIKLIRLPIDKTLTLRTNMNLIRHRSIDGRRSILWT
jgi:hypothetical protein